MSNVRKVFQANDGSIFDTAAEANEHNRAPKIREAMMVATGNNTDLCEWLMANQSTVESAFEAGTIRRVTKAERNKLQKAIEQLTKLEESATVKDSKLAFLVEHGESIVETFRWPSVKRMDEAEKAEAAKNTRMLASENNEGLADCVLANKDGIIAANGGGKEKRVVSTKATEALAAYRAKKAAEKAAKEAAESEAATPAV